MPDTIRFATWPAPVSASIARLSGLVLASALALSLSACGPKGGGQAPESAESASAGSSAATGEAGAAKVAGSSPSLSVEVTSPKALAWDVRLTANGPIAAWQEGSVAAEVSGLRLVSIKVEVGDKVHKGQLLAKFAADSIEADLQAARGALAEAEALSAEAKGNADRARRLQGSGALSPQDAQRFLTAEATANARAASAKAQLQTQRLRMSHTDVVAPDDGVVSFRSATLGAVGQAGQEMFRIVRKNRLQWRAEVPASDLPSLRAGQTAVVNLPGLAKPLEGHVRVVSPTVDGQTRNGMVYVDLPDNALALGARPGMFASGWLAQGQANGLTLPQTAVALSDGFSYVFVIDGQTVRRTKVQVGRHEGGRVEIVSGLKPGLQVVAAGVGLLSDGDTVRIVAAKPSAMPAAKPAQE